MWALWEQGAFVVSSPSTGKPPLLPGLEDNCERLTIEEMRSVASCAEFKSSMPDKAACSMICAVLALTLVAMGCTLINGEELPAPAS
jgi:hypothetical protein